MRSATMMAGVLPLLIVSLAAAEEFTSGIAVGGGISTYSTTKAGGVDDGVDVGKSLCYT